MQTARGIKLYSQILHSQLQISKNLLKKVILWCIINLSEQSDKVRPCVNNTGGCALTFICTGFRAEFMKGGMLMNKVSKHFATYGKKADCISFYSYHSFDDDFHKSIVTASAKTVTIIL